MQQNTVNNRGDIMPEESTEPPSFYGLKENNTEAGESEEPPSLFPHLTYDGFGDTRTQPAKVVIQPKKSIANERSFNFFRKYYADSRITEWNDWRWQLRNRIRNTAALSHILALSENERLALEAHGGLWPLSITPYYASLLDKNDSSSPLRRCVVPVSDEFIRSPGEAVDPLSEDEDSPVQGLVHRYPDRVLFLATDFCSTYCRYCTRSRIVGRSRGEGYCLAKWKTAIAYIESNTEIRDVLISGGDPLTLPDKELEWLLTNLRKIPHIEIIRIGTKVPAVLPQRVTPALVRMLKKYHPLWINIHFTHPDELTAECGEACGRLADAGIPLGSQTVLLKGVNDDVMTMRKLYQGLLRFRVRPYYLYQCDPIIGSSHFRTPVEKGLEIIDGIRGHTTGLAVPHYVIDAPGGGGKIPLLPEYVKGRIGNDVILRNYENLTFSYPDSGGGAKPAGVSRA